MKTWHWSALIGITLVSLVSEFTSPVDTASAHPWWASVPAFFAVFGFVGCVVIILVAKGLGKFMLQRKEDYYNAE